MMFIPPNVKWFIAVQVEEFQVEGETENLVYLNNILIKANSAEMAYTRAMELCAQSNHTYQNSDGKTVVCAFRGLSDLFPIHDELEDGAELSFKNLESLRSPRSSAPKTSWSCSIQTRKRRNNESQ